MNDKDVIDGHDIRGQFSVLRFPAGLGGNAAWRPVKERKVITQYDCNHCEDDTLNYLTPDQIETFHEDGYLAFDGLLPADLNERIKADVDQMMEDRKAGERSRSPITYPDMGLLTSEPLIVDRVADLLGPRFSHHHIHARWQGSGEPGVHWHHDYEQYPQTNRSHPMVHVFMYLDGLNGEIGDLLVLPGSHKRILNRDALQEFGSSDLPGSVTINALGPGSIVIVHSAVLHARRPKPGGESYRRYFIDTSYCPDGILWPLGKYHQSLNQHAFDNGYDRNGKYAFLYDNSRFYDFDEYKERLHEHNVGSLALIIQP